MRPSYYSIQSNKAFSHIPAVESRNRDTMHAWECFVEEGQANYDIEKTVRSEILASWTRSTNSGVSALSTATPQKFEDNDIYLLRRKNRYLREAAALAFERLTPHLSGTGAMLILTDQNGTVIEVIGDSQTLEAGREIQLEIGGVWDERVIGTNGIGTALSTGMPTYVHASEHFCQGIKAWTCVGVPIFDVLDRSVIGVVDLSGPSSIYHAHNVALVVATAREIESNLAQRQREEHTTLLEEFINNPKRHNSDNAIVLLNSSGKIVYSRNTEKLKIKGFSNFRTGTQLLDLYPNMSADELAAALPPTLPAKDIDLIKAGGKTQGVALFLRDQPDSTPQPRYSGVFIKPRLGILEDEVEIVGESSKMKESIGFARRAAEMNLPVLIQGETGVGKELFARLIHSHLAEKTTPYVVVNCATMCADLIRRELFGYVTGSSAGGSREGKLGKFEQANTGVLCLDEIGDMPLELQTYLLRTLEQRAVYRVGCDIRRPIDVLPIAMSSRNLRNDILSGRFRQDLFYRIGTIVIDVPPLRERGHDIERLIEYFNQKLSNKYGRDMLKFDVATMSALQQYHWPGNVRELRNIIERLYLLIQKEFVSLSDLPDEIVKPNANSSLSVDNASAQKNRPMDLEEIESIAIQRSINLANGNLVKAALSLGISRPTLYRKIKHYGLDRQ